MSLRIGAMLALFLVLATGGCNTTAPAPVGDATVPYGPEGLEGDY